MKKRKEAVLDAIIAKVFSAEEVKSLSAAEITDTLQTYFTYDDYRWQYDTKLAITYEKRAEGLELPLYQCPNCKAEYQIQSKGIRTYRI